MLEKGLKERIDDVNNCLVCGTELKEKRRKYCSLECFQSVPKTFAGKQRTAYEPRMCEACGKQLNRNQLKSKNKYCSLDCSVKANTTRSYAVCKNCGKEYLPKAVDRTTFCSRECAFEYKSNNKKPKEHKAKDPTVYSKECAVCGTPFKTTYSNQKYCSKDCGKVVVSNNQKAKHRNDFVPTDAICQNCGKVFTTTYGESKVYCSTECKRNYANHYREVNRRHSIKRNGTIHWGITLNKLIKRDKNICHICGVKCDIKDYKRDEQGSFVVGGKYPSIDHIQPVSKGGTHTWDNVKLAHHYCNTVKSDKNVFCERNGQIRLCV